MAAIESIRRVTVVGRSDGLQKVVSDVNSLTTAQENLGRASATTATVTETSTRQQLSAANAWDRLRRSIDEEYRAQQNVARGQEVLNRALNQGLIDATQLATAQEQLAAKYLRTSEAADRAAAATAKLNAEQKANSALSGLGGASAASSALIRGNERANALLGSLGSPAALQAIDNVAKSTRLASHEVTNLAAQFQDIGVSLAAGQSPFLVMAQQGSQISQILGDRGVKGILGALGQGLLSLINPTTLALGGIVLGGYGAYAAFQALSGETENLDELLERSAKTVDRVRDAYDGAGTAAGKFAERSREVLTLQATEELNRLQRQLEEFRQKASGSLFTISNVTDPMGNVTGLQTEELQARFAAFGEVINRFRADVLAGRGDIRAFADEISKIGTVTPALTNWLRRSSATSSLASTWLAQSRRPPPHSQSCRAMHRAPRRSSSGSPSGSAKPREPRTCCSISSASSIELATNERNMSEGTPTSSARL